MDKPIFISVVATALIIGAAFWFVGARPTPDTGGGDQSVVSVVDGIQRIDITAKGGYAPRRIVATAGLPTVLRIRTNGTFDCSASLVIPKLSYQKFLAPSGIEEIAVAPEKAEGTLQGLCAMGMYSFQVVFK